MQKLVFVRKNTGSVEAYEGLLKKAWNSVPNGEVLQWSTSQAGGRGTQRTMRYVHLPACMQPYMTTFSILER